MYVIMVNKLEKSIFYNDCVENEFFNMKFSSLSFEVENICFISVRCELEVFRERKEVFRERK